MAPKFGTSGVRGLVTDLTDGFVADYVNSFLSHCDTGGAVYVGQDLRASSQRIANAVMTTAQARGLQVFDCGVLPTPALAYAAETAGKSAIMITGSHIPADRNGIKFYTTQGEISKQDEANIVAGLGQTFDTLDAKGSVQQVADQAIAAYTSRYVEAFGADAIQGLRIGVYQHSSVARDILVDMLSQLGADVVPLERTTEFVPVDTEAVDPDARAKFQNWCAEHTLDALVSTDGDADRPMVTDHTGAIVPGDVLGALTAQYLDADHICTPVSSNSMISQMPEFKAVDLTKIGSPYVVAAIETVQKTKPDAKVVGYEANGGFLLGFNVKGLTPLLTRDCALPIVATLAAAKGRGLALAELAADLPAVFTAADRIAGIETTVSQAFIKDLMEDAGARAGFFDHGARIEALDKTDGLRVRFDASEIVHLRPSGNAPEFRCYAEAPSAPRAQELVSFYLNKLSKQLG